MTRLVLAYYVAVAICSASMAYYALTTVKRATRAVDCAVLIGGWHPDVPKEAQEECRKASR